LVLAVAVEQVQLETAEMLQLVEVMVVMVLVPQLPDQLSLVVEVEVVELLALAS
jgi:hypothetical protein